MEKHSTCCLGASLPRTVRGQTNNSKMLGAIHRCHEEKPFWSWQIVQGFKHMPCMQLTLVIILVPKHMVTKAPLGIPEHCRARGSDSYIDSPAWLVKNYWVGPPGFLISAEK